MPDTSILDPEVTASGQWVRISIKDSGIGIRTEDIERIFEPFEQVENSKTRRFQGTGLGLSLTKNFVEIHGGIIWAESEGKDKGSTFSLILPVAGERDCSQKP